MSAANLVNTCPSCGAEESLDALLARMIEDDQVRRLIADVLTRSLPLGGQVVAYLRLHKPAKQKLRMSRVQQLLAELVPDILRGAITRKGRDWTAPHDTWKAAFAAVMEARDKGTLELPLEGNAYLYEVVMRMVDKFEATQERETDAARRGRAHQGGAASVGEVLASAAPTEAPSAPAMPAVAPPRPTGPSRAALRMAAEAKAALEQRGRTNPSSSTETTSQA